jgi:transposase
MSQSHTLSVGMEVHQASIAVASVAQDHGAEVISLGTIGTRQGASEKLLRQLQSTSQPLVCVDEAGPCGSWLARFLTTKGDGCWVVALSLLPTKPGDRVTTDRRDARPLARLMRSGDLPPVSVPAVDDAAMRDLRRAREETLRDLQAATLRRTACVLRHAIRSPGRAHWSPAPLRWLSEVVCPMPAPQLGLQADVQTVPEQTARRQRLAPALRDQGPTWRFQPVVEALQALRGVQCTVAVSTVAALGALTRCDTPRPLMHSLGLTPAEDASGARRQQGRMTKTGHTQARRALVEGAWAYRYPATIRRHLPRRLAKRPTAIQASSWQAQGRLCTRDRQLLAQGKQAHQVVVAMAREWRAFLGAMAKQRAVPSPAERSLLVAAKAL